MKTHLADYQIDNLNLKRSNSYNFAAKVFRIIGIPLTFAGVFWLLVWMVILPFWEGGAYYNWYNKLSLPGVLLGLILLLIAKKLMAVSLNNKSFDESQPFVLYLRPFKKDETIWWRFLLGLLNPVFLLSMFATFEEQLSDATRRLGQLVAIGDPRRSPAKPGAKRILSSNEEWRNIITRLFNKAHLVIIRPGASKSMQWEFNTAFELLNPQKLAILFYGQNKNEYNSAIEWINEYLEHPLPKLNRRRAFLLVFDEHWWPSISPLRVPVLKTNIYKPWRRRLIYGLKPIFQNLRAKWHQPPISIFISMILLYYSIVYIYLLLLFLR